MKRTKRPKPNRRGDNADAARAPQQPPPAAGPDLAATPAGGSVAGGRRRPKPWVIALALAVASFALYIPILFNDFVLLDDLQYVHKRPIVQQGLTLEGVRWAFTTTTFSNWLPVTWLSHMLDCELYGMWAGGHHLTSAILHAVNAALVFFVLRAMTGSLWRAAAVAALFAVHPIRVESVAWVAERKDVLCGTFGLLAMLVWTGYCRTGCPGRYVAALVLYALGLMSKTMIVTFPFLFLLLDFWPLRRVPGIERLLLTTGSTASPADPPAAPAFPQRRWRLLLIEKLPLLALAAIASAWTAYLQRAGGAMHAGGQLTFDQRLANAVVSVARYLWKTVRPVDLSVLYPHPGSWPVWAVVGATLLLLALTAAVLIPLRRRPYLAVGWFWFLGMLVPVAGIVQVGAQAMADRYMYLPGIGLLIAVAWGVADLGRRVPQVRAASRPVLAALLVGLGVTTVIQQRYWRDTFHLFEQAVAVDPRVWMAHGLLGQAFHQIGDDATAVKHLRIAAEIEPDHPDAWHNLGVSLKSLGQREQAMAAFSRAAQLHPPRAASFAEIGGLLAERREWPAADAAFAQAERLDPATAAYPIARGGVALATGRRAEAAEHFRRALQIEPGNAQARQGLDEASAPQTAPSDGGTAGKPAR